MTAPRVSVVIPTVGRNSLEGAVACALRQLDVDIEVVVVADRPIAPGRVNDLEARGRVIVHTTPTPLGGNGARNLGVSVASGDWVAFLDDDDLWADDKLARQLVGRDPSERTLIACSVSPTDRDAVWPNQAPSEFAHLSEFFFLRRSRHQGNYLQTSTLVCPRHLALSIPLDPTLPILQDIDWVLRLVVGHHVSLHFVPDVLVEYFISSNNESTSRQARADECRAWGDTHRELLTDRAYAAFLLLVVAERAARSFEAKKFVSAVRAAASTGEMRAKDLMIALGFLVLRPRLRAFIRRGTRRA